MCSEVLCLVWDSVSLAKGRITKCKMHSVKESHNGQFASCIHLVSVFIHMVPLVLYPTDHLYTNAPHISPGRSRKRGTVAALCLYAGYCWSSLHREHQ